MSFKIFNSKAVIFLGVLIYFREVVMQPNPPIIRSCNNTLIQDHIHKWNHSYCFHMCNIWSRGISPVNDPTECTTDGDCFCGHYCSNNDTILQKDFSFDATYCNPPRVEEEPTPVDPDHLAHPQCISRCAARCPGGSGTICGEVTKLQDSGVNNTASMYTKICTCFCPVQRCPVPPMPPANYNIINNTNHTRVVVISISNTTTNNNTTTVVIPSTPTIEIQDILAIFFLIVKVYAVSAVQTVFWGFYYTLFYGVVSLTQLV